MGKHNISVYDFCEAFLTNRTLISVECLCGEEPLFEGTVKELYDTFDADVRAMCRTVAVKKIVPSTSLLKGIPLSVTLLI